MKSMLAISSRLQKVNVVNGKPKVNAFLNEVRNAIVSRSVYSIYHCILHTFLQINEMAILIPNINLIEVFHEIKVSEACMCCKWDFWIFLYVVSSELHVRILLLLM